MFRKKLLKVAAVTALAVSTTGVIDVSPSSAGMNCSVGNGHGHNWGTTQHKQSGISSSGSYRKLKWYYMDWTNVPNTSYLGTKWCLNH